MQSLFSLLNYLLMLMMSEMLPTYQYYKYSLIYSIGMYVTEFDSIC